MPIVKTPPRPTAEANAAEPTEAPKPLAVVGRSSPGTGPPPYQAYSALGKQLSTTFFEKYGVCFLSFSFFFFFSYPQTREACQRWCMFRWHPMSFCMAARLHGCILNNARQLAGSRVI